MQPPPTLHARPASTKPRRPSGRSPNPGGRLAVLALALAFATSSLVGCAGLRARFFPPPSPLPSANRAPARGEGASAVCRPDPAVAALVHVVREGETLSTIASRYRVSALDLFAVNALPDPDRIEVGQRLVLPAKAVVPPPQSPQAPQAPRSPLRSRPSARASQLLADAEEHYRAARFDEALAASRAASLAMQADSDRKGELARAAFLAGSALAGLGDEQRASEEFRRVRAIDARFTPPDGWLSPGLAALYDRRD